MEELIKIQSELKAPKNQLNKFGNYYYRSCEDILEAVKPLLDKQSCILTLSDEIFNTGNRYYIKATATITNLQGKYVSTTAFAREDDAKKGFDGAQLSGSTSSYARKYALNGLFCIDDEKDSDSNEQLLQSGSANKQPSKPVQPAHPVSDPIATAQPMQSQPKHRITMDMLEDQVKCDCLMRWIYDFWTATSYAPSFDARSRLLKSYDADSNVVERFVALFESYKTARLNKK